MPILFRFKLHTEEMSLGLHATSLQKALILEKKNAFFRKLASWQEVQAFYLPTIVTLRNKDKVDNDVTLYKAELFLPSQIKTSLNWDDRLIRLGEYEWILRQAQAGDSLTKLRDLLRLRDFLIKKKKNWSCGVQQNTRSQSEINKAEKKIKACAAKYRAAYSALGVLAQILEKGISWSMEFQQLKEDDIKGLPAEGWGEGTRTLSWIWKAPGVVNAEMNNPQLIDGASCNFFHDVDLAFFYIALRVQWCRTRARAMRWSEEVLLVQEEMRRVLDFMSWYADWWTSHAAFPSIHDPELAEGLTAYATKQADLRLSLRSHFGILWKDVQSQIEVNKVSGV